MRTEVRLALEAAKSECSGAARRLINLALDTEAEEFDPVSDVENFHRQFSLEYTGKPRMLPDDLRSFRSNFSGEEEKEYETHASGLSVILQPSLVSDPNFNHNVSFHLGEMLDALVDSVYVKLGTAHLHGFNFREAWKRVHRQNMLKVKPTSADQSLRHSLHDVVKPKNWVRPDHSDLVEDNIHRR